MNIIVCGIGGQGIIFFSSILAEAFNNLKQKVQYYKVFDEGQRNGSVSCHIRINEEDSPLIDNGHADILASLNYIETQRNLGFLKLGGKIIEAENNIELLAKIISEINIPIAEIKKVLLSKKNPEDNVEKLEKFINKNSDN